MRMTLEPYEAARTEHESRFVRPTRAVHPHLLGHPAPVPRQTSMRASATPVQGVRRRWSGIELPRRTVQGLVLVAVKTAPESKGGDSGRGRATFRAIA